MKMTLEQAEALGDIAESYMSNGQLHSASVMYLRAIYALLMGQVERPDPGDCQCNVCCHVRVQAQRLASLPGEFMR